MKSAMVCRLLVAIVLPVFLPVAALSIANELPKEKDMSKPVIHRFLHGQAPAAQKVLVAQSTKTRRQSMSMRGGKVPEQIEEWHDSNKAQKSSLTSDDIKAMTAAITPEAFNEAMHAIVDPDPTRMVGFEGNTIAADNIEKTFRGLGLKTEVQDVDPYSLKQYVGSNPFAGNVMGYLKGSDDRSKEVVIVACHYDSVNWDNIQGKAQGVDDNGSGVALVTQLAKAFTKSGKKPRRSLLFVAFQAEEEGLVGSKAFAKYFAEGGTGVEKWGKPVAALVADEVAWPGKTNAQRKVIFETKGHGADHVVDTLAKAAQNECQGDCTKNGHVNGFVVNYHGFGSDHISMLDVGIPAVLLIERDNMYHANTWGHTDQDTFEHVDKVFGASTTRLALEAVARLANPE